MNRRLVARRLLATAASRASESFDGNWTIQRSDEPRKLEFGFDSVTRMAILRIANRASRFKQFCGNGHFRNPATRTVKFRGCARCRGCFECEGRVKQLRRGVFHFFPPDSKYTSERKDHGASTSRRSPILTRICLTTDSRTPTIN